MGIALNFGLHYAIENQFDWLATFDQDSQPTKGMLDKMLEDFSKYPNPNRVRILAPRHLDPSQFSNHPVVPNEDLGFQEMETVITSGNLIKLDGLDENLRFDEELFIDSIDHDFCLKVLKHDEIILECKDALLIHSIGNISHHRLAGIDVHVTNHTPLRHYYMTRNRLYIWARYLFHFPLWVASDLYAHIKMVMRLLLLEEEKLSKLNYMAKGLVDFLTGKKGQIHD